VFEGPGGQKTLELRVFDGQGGEPPTADASANAQPGGDMQPAPPSRPQVQPAVAGGAGAPKPEGPAKAPVNQAANTEQQMDALRKRIEQRRAQLRAQQAREAADPATTPDNP
jgi:general secretion pathway protein N